MKSALAAMLLLFSTLGNAAGLSCEQWAGYTYYLGQFAEYDMPRDDMIHEVIGINTDKVSSEDMERLLRLVQLLYAKPGDPEKQAKRVYAACQGRNLDGLLGRNV